MLGLTASMRDAWDPASPRGEIPANCSLQWVLSQDATLWQDRAHAHSCLCTLLLQNLFVMGPSMGLKGTLC